MILNSVFFELRDLAEETFEVGEEQCVVSCEPENEDELVVVD